MKPCFADTSYFVALVSPGDVNHKRANKLADVFRGPIVTSAYVIVEVGNFFSAPISRQKFKGFMDVVDSDPRTQIIPAASSLLRRAIDLFVARHDKAWSLTDCTSFIIMRDQGLRDALTADHHFEQAGFTVLLKNLSST